jgi:hypothetical protein
MANGQLLWKRLAWPLALATMIALVFAQATLARTGELTEINVPKKLMKKLKSFEPSAALALSADDGYLIASDDTTENDDAMLFLMDGQGNVNKEPVVISGLEKMTDIESLSADGDWIYAMGSQSRNKKGKEKEERNLFVRGKLVGGQLAETEIIELRSQLLRALPKVAALSSVKAKLNQKLEIEASFVKDGRLFVGLKDPQPRPGTGLLLELGDAQALFSGESLEASNILLAAELDFAANGGSLEKISDIVPTGDKLLIAATLEAGGGSLWTFEHGKLERVAEFPDHQPEGLAPGENNETLVVFDQGEDAALFGHVRF